LSDQQSLGALVLESESETAGLADKLEKDMVLEEVLAKYELCSLLGKRVEATSSMTDTKTMKGRWRVARQRSFLQDVMMPLVTGGELLSDEDLPPTDEELKEIEFNERISQIIGKVKAVKQRLSRLQVTTQRAPDPTTPIVSRAFFFPNWQPPGKEEDVSLSLSAMDNWPKPLNRLLVDESKEVDVSPSLAAGIPQVEITEPDTVLDDRLSQQSQLSEAKPTCRERAALCVSQSVREIGKNAMRLANRGRIKTRAVTAKSASYAKKVAKAGATRVARRANRTRDVLRNKYGHTKTWRTMESVAILLERLYGRCRHTW
jgi:hypothetical protein